LLVLTDLQDVIK